MMRLYTSRDAEAVARHWAQHARAAIEAVELCRLQDEEARDLCARGEWPDAPVTLPRTWARLELSVYTYTKLAAHAAGVCLDLKGLGR